MTKNYVCCTSCLRNHAYYDLDLWCTCIKWWYIQVFLHFFQILIFGVSTGTKEQKMTWNDNYVCRIPYLSKHTSYDCVFLLRKFKMMTSPDVCFIFSKFWFLWVIRGRGVTGQKMGQSGKKFCLTPYLRNFTSYDCVFWYTCVKWWYLQNFFQFFKSLICRVFQSLSMNGKMKFLRCAPPSSLVCDFFFQKCT